MRTEQPLLTAPSPPLPPSLPITARPATRAALLLSTALTGILAAGALVSRPAGAQDATWLASPGSADYSSGANWSTGAVPTGTASFGASSITNLTHSAITGVGGWTFDASASAYTFANLGGFQSFNGAGIVVNGGSISIDNFAFTSFNNSSSAGTAAFTNSAFLEFNNGSTAGTATIANSGLTTFRNNGTAASATINNAAFLSFYNNSTAGTAAITNTSGSSLIFLQSSTAGNATIGGGHVEFQGTSSAGSANITVDQQPIQFIDSSTAGNANIAIATPSSGMFRDTSSAGNAQIVNSGSLNFEGASTAANASINNSGIIRFDVNSTAGNATITNTHVLNFAGNSTAGSATINNRQGMAFGLRATAGSATITNSNGGDLFFSGTGTAGSATIVNNFGSRIEFDEGSSAGNATISNAATVDFIGTSTAGSATITNSNGGDLFFYFNSTAGAARLIADAGSDVSFSFTSGQLGDNRVSAGSIEGAARYWLGANELTVGSNNLSTEVSGVIAVSGGSLVKTGTGTLTLSGANTYGGGTTVTGGLVNFATPDNLGTGTVTLNGGGLQWAAGNTIDITPRLNALGAGGGTFDTNGNDVTLANGISGAGNLTKAGAGTLTLAGNNSYAGGTTINGGTVSISSDGNLGAASGALVLAGGTLATTGTFSTSRGTTLNAGGGTFDTAAGTTLSHGGTVGGSGALTKAGAGTLILSGANSYSGGTTVMGGVLQGTTSSLQGNILNNASVAFDQTAGGSYAGDMSGTGALTKTGAGTLILGGNNSYTGGTTVTGGVLQGNTQSLQGNIVNNALVVFNQATNGSYAGTMSGSGGLLLAGSGTVALSGANSYAGGTTITAGLANFSALGNFGTGTVTLNGGGVQWATGTATDISSRLAPMGAGGGTFDTNGNDVSLTNGISGAGGLTKAGLGRLTLTGNNSYAGGTTINGGTVSISSDGNLGAASGALVLAGGTLATTLSLSTARATTLAAGGGIFNAAADTTLTHAGTIGGAGGLLVSGTGSVTLTGANSYAGGTTVNGSTLSVAADASLGDAAGTVAFGGGTLQTTGTFSTSRGTTLNAGGGTFDTAAGTTLSHGGGIGGAGALRKTGAGTLILAGNNSYTGGTTVTGGVLQGNTQSLQGNIVNNALVVFNQATNGSYAGTMSGSGGLLLSGSGTVALSGANSYAGGTTITAGLANFSALGNFGIGTVTLNGGGVQWAAGTTTDISSRLAPMGAGGGTFDTNGNDVALANGIAGAGNLTKAGLGRLTLAGNNSYTGGTFVTNGTLAVTGSLAGPVTVNGGLFSMNGTSTGTVILGGTGTLGGSGTIGGLAMSGGTLAPGNSIGTLNVSGNLVQSGGVYQVEVNAAGQSDKIIATGTAAIGGSAVQVVAQQGSYARNTTYTILTANGGVTGTYSGVTANFAFLTPTLSYDANNVFLNLEMLQNAFAAAAQTPNQYAVGAALDIAQPSATGDFATVLGALAVLNTQQGPAALTALSGQNYSSFSSSLVQTAQMFMNNFSAQAGGGKRVGVPSTAARGNRVEMAEACDVACEPGAADGWGVWGGAVGATGTIAGNSNAGTMTYNAGGFVAGIDRKLAPELLVGFTVGYAGGNQWTSGFAGRGSANTVQAGLYASFVKGPFYVDGLLGYAYANNQMTRQIVIPGLAARTATGSTGANQFFGQVEAGYRLDLGGRAAAYLTPFARLQGSTARQNGFTESGADSLDLSVAAQTTDSLRSVIGAELGGAMDMGWRDKLTAQFKLGWGHEFASTDRPVTAAFAGAPAVPFTTFGAAPNRDGVVLGFNATTAIAERTSLFVRYEGQVSGADNMHSGTVGVRFTW